MVRCVTVEEEFAAHVILVWENRVNAPRYRLALAAAIGEGPEWEVGFSRRVGQVFT